MEIKNNKDEVPFERYYDAFVSIDPAEAAARCAAEFDGEKFTFVMMGEEVSLTFPGGELVGAEKLRARELPSRLLLVRYLISGKRQESSGKFLAYRDMPWGQVYSANFQGRCIMRTAFAFGSKLKEFEAAMLKCGAVKLRQGDMAYMVEFLPGLFMQFIIWEGDDEFPPSAQILFSDNFSAAFTAEDMAVVGDIAIDRLKALSQEG